MRVRRRQNWKETPQPSSELSIEQGGLSADALAFRDPLEQQPGRPCGTRDVSRDKVEPLRAGRLWRGTRVTPSRERSH